MKKKKDRLTQERGHRVGTKRSDRRWQDEHGEIWASRFECLVYESARRAALKVRRCDKGGSDTVSYTSPVRNGVCQSCKGTAVVQERRYSPDLRILSDEGKEGAGSAGYYAEIKGYLRAPERGLLRDIISSGAIADLRIILQADYKLGSHTLGWWIDRYLKCKWAVFDGEYPKVWNQVELKKGKGAKAGNKGVRQGGVLRPRTK